MIRGNGRPRAVKPDRSAKYKRGNRFDGLSLFEIAETAA
jgi:hypothetical protein